MPDPVEVPEFLEPFNRSFIDVFGEEKYAKFVSFLPTVGGIIAGGSVLRAIKGEPAADFDIYVPNDKIAETYKFIFNDIFDTEKRRMIKMYKSSFYCQSFLKRNKIRAVYNIKGFIGRALVIFDIMAVRKQKTPEQVAQNFDLTFCQVWFDGNTIKATHPDDIRNKSGMLQGDYVKLFIAGNKFLRQRLDKYIRREYRVSFENIEEVSRNYTYEYKKVCDVVDKESPEYLKLWGTTRMLFQVLYPDTFLNQKVYYGNNLEGSITSEKHKILERPIIGIFNNKYINPTDGYDTDDYIEDKSKLYEVAKKIFDNVKSNFETTSALHRMVIDKIYGKNIQTKEFSPIGIFTEVGMYKINNILYIYDSIGDAGLNLKKYAYKLQEFIKNPGTDSVTYDDEEPVYNFHNHTDEQAINKSSLERHFEQFVSQDKGEESTFPCYLNTKIDPNVCNHVFTMKNVRALMSEEFWTRFNKPPSALETSAIAMSEEQILKNVPTQTKNNAWGELYHEVICPYCLKDESRERGCLYMTHENPQRLPTNKSPFCNSEFVVDDLVNKYREIARNHYKHDRFALEFCVECGRPCVNHAHFDLSGGILFPKNPHHGRCPGGGRKEMIARLLAIRKVLRERGEDGFENEKEKRRLCAEAAEAAAADPVMLARGQAILDSEPRRWNNLGSAEEQSDSKEREDNENENGNENENENQNENDNDNGIENYNWNDNNNRNLNNRELPENNNFWERDEQPAAEPAQPAEPAEPAQPAEPAEPAEPAQPAQPAEPAEPAQPVDAAAPPAQPAPPPQPPAQQQQQQGPLNNMINLLQRRIRGDQQGGYRRTYKNSAKRMARRKTRSA